MAACDLMLRNLEDDVQLDLRNVTPRAAMVVLIMEEGCVPVTSTW